jgi:oxygen-independent coproporphyrinogen-3 oxidase
MNPSPCHLVTLSPCHPIPGLYVHIPFCFHKCHYCDFYSITRQGPERLRKFVDLVLAEADQWAKSADRSDNENLPIHQSPHPNPPPEYQGRGLDVRLQPRTVFFGGGTPSLLPMDEMRRLLIGLQKRFDFSQCDEWTVEVNPATVNVDYCRMLRQHGVTRLSMGAQSFDRAELAVLERHHEPEQIGQSLDAARSAGFTRINLDLIYAICGQSMESWQRSLEAALKFQTTHLSCYGLTYEPNTALTVRKRLGRVRAVEEEVELEMLHWTRRRLAEAGLPAYEISNYSRPGEECRHNLLYWTGGDYIGLGPSAASHVQGRRWKNRRHLGEWERVIEAGELPMEESEELSPPRRAGELAMLLLRLSRGLNYQEFQNRRGMDARSLFADPIERFSQMGLLEADEFGVRLSERGLAVADSLAAEFILDDERREMRTED